MSDEPHEYDTETPEGRAAFYNEHSPYSGDIFTGETQDDDVLWQDDDWITAGREYYKWVEGEYPEESQGWFGGSRYGTDVDSEEFRRGLTDWIEDNIDGFNNNTVTMGLATARLATTDSADGPLAMAYLMDRNDHTNTSWGDVRRGVWQGIVTEITTIPTIAAGFFTLGTGAVAAAGAKETARRFAMKEVKDWVKDQIRETATDGIIKGVARSTVRNTISVGRVALDNPVTRGFGIRNPILNIGAAGATAGTLDGTIFGAGYQNLMTTSGRNASWDWGRHAEDTALGTVAGGALGVGFLGAGRGLQRFGQLSNRMKFAAAAGLLTVGGGTAAYAMSPAERAGLSAEDQALLEETMDLMTDSGVVSDAENSPDSTVTPTIGYDFETSSGQHQIGTTTGAFGISSSATALIGTGLPVARHSEEQSASQATPARFENYHIQQGDTLSLIVQEQYDNPENPMSQSYILAICEKLKDLNGNINDINLILAGDTIKLPETLADLDRLLAQDITANTVVNNAEGPQAR